MSTTPRRPPIKCAPCRVTYEGQRYQIEANGEVRPTLDKVMPATTRLACLPLPESEAKLIRREASRQRRNRNARERNQAMRDLGLKRTSCGWE